MCNLHMKPRDTIVKVVFLCDEYAKLCSWCFLRESSARHHPSFQHVEVRDASEDEAYWDSMGNIISEDKLKLWGAGEEVLKHYQ